MLLRTITASLPILAFSGAQDQTWLLWKEKYAKSYSKPEEAIRYKIFRTNLDAINKHNAEKSTFQRGLNAFSDLTEEEFSAQRLMDLPYPEEQSELACPISYEPKLVNVPNACDWRDASKNPEKIVAVTAVKDQGACGSCYSFSATGTMEGALCLRGYQNCTTWSGLSEQMILDCGSYSPRQYDFETEPEWYNFNGCFGGWQSNVIEFVYYNRGIMSEADYPYKSGNAGAYPESKMNVGECQYDAAKAVGTADKHICGTTSRDGADWKSMQNAIWFKGPLAVGMYVGGSFQSYTSGVYVPQAGDCDNFESTGINHALLAVGFGEDVNANGEVTPYWIIKNSWGASWGDEGYIKVIKGVNACGIEGNTAYTEMKPVE